MKTKIWTHLAAWPILLAGSGAMAQQASVDNPAAYSHKVALTISGKNALVSVRLPQAVYLNARSASLADLRIFDAAGKALPYALIEAASQTRNSQRLLPVKMFPAPMVDASAGTSRNDVEIRTSADGSVTSVSAVTTRAAQGAAGTPEVPGSLVLDLGPGAAGVDALVFTLPDGTSNYQADVALDTSTDLRQWEPAGTASLSWLTNSERETVSSNRIDFDARVFRYARVTWRQGKPLLFARIDAQSPVSTDAAPVLDSIVLQPAPGRFQGDVVYNSAAAIPVRRLSVRFTQQNVVLPAQLGIYVERPSVQGGAATRWDFQPRMQATFFRISQNGKVREAGDIALDEAHVAQWVLRPQAPTGELPLLHASWLPATAVFMASGRAPYTLAVGRDESPSGQRDIAQVAPGFSATELQALERAVPGAVIASGTVSNAASEAEQVARAARRRVMLLWGVLLLGVAALSVMVWKLTKQVNTPQ